MSRATTSGLRRRWIGFALLFALFGAACAPDESGAGSTANGPSRAATASSAPEESTRGKGWGPDQNLPIELGPRPLYLVNLLPEGPLRDELLACRAGPFHKSDFSLGHRGAALMFPEHSRESYEAAALMGAGFIECDVTFTRDRELVCRHSQCDLHETTNILEIPALAQKCSEPFVPADPEKGTRASARCCTSDITLSEFKSLCARMEGYDPEATTAAQYMAGTPGYRTGLYESCSEPLTHAESVALIRSLGAKFTPELKEPEVPMPFEGDYTQEMYAQQLIDAYKEAGIPPGDVMAQSFQLQDVLYWLEHEPEFGRQAVFLDETLETEAEMSAAIERLPELVDQGVKIYAPPLFALVTLDGDDTIAPSRLATAARAAGLELVAWSFDRSPPDKSDDYYYQSIASRARTPAVIYELMDVLARQVGVRAVFTDWPATATYYANCTGR